MTIIQISAWIMLVSCGLWAGGILIFAVERTNMWGRMPIDQYAVDFRRSLFRVDPMMPILGVIAGVAATIFALKHSGAQGLRVGRAWIYCARGGGVHYHRRADQLQVPSAARGAGAATGRTLPDPLAALSCGEKSRGPGSARMPRGRGRLALKLLMSTIGPKRQWRCVATMRPKSG